jgi:predicted glycosyltransferase
VSSVLLTHQLFLRIPNSLLKMTANGILHRAMAGFDAIWVPDEAKMPNLSGALSHGPPIHPATHYTGILTRMQAQQIPKEYDVAVVLSGPEPQRSLLEQEILRQALDIPLKFLFVLGKTQTREQFKPAKHIQVVSYLTSTELNQALNASDYVICRSGYSSLMDLAALGKKAILIPTPGQTEQEYLASRLAESGKFIVQNQHQIDLLKGLSEINKTTGFEPNAFNTNIYHHTITTWISNLNAPPHH